MDAAREALTAAFAAGTPVQGKVGSTNKGGFTVDLGGQRGFCPFSQMDLRRVEEEGGDSLARDLVVRRQENALDPERLEPDVAPLFALLEHHDEVDLWIIELAGSQEERINGLSFSLDNNREHNIELVRCGQRGH